MKLRTIASVICTFSLPSFAQDLPSNLPTIESLDAYLNYLTKPDHRAFAISEDGAYGSAWSYASTAEAASFAMARCREGVRTQTCTVVSTNGSVQGEISSASKLRLDLEYARTKTWAVVDDKYIPRELIGRHKAVADYRGYLGLNGQKAFALAADGAWAYSYGNARQSVAKANALTDCNRYTKNKGSCAVIDINSRAVSGSETYISPPMLNGPDTELVPLAIKTYDQWRLYRRFLDRPGHRAFAVGGATHSGYGSNKASLEAARRMALEKCDVRFLGECRIIVENDKILVDSVNEKQLILAPDPLRFDAEDRVKALFGSRWNEYLRAEGHKAFAANKYYAQGFVVTYLNSGYAQEDALAQCEQFNTLRRQNKNNRLVAAPCQIIAVNNDLRLENIEKIFAQ